MANSLTNDAVVVNTLAACRHLASSFSYSFKRRDLEEAQTVLNLPKWSLAPDCQTRWGSKHKMVTRVLEYESALCHVYSNRQHKHLIPSANKFTVLESVKTALNPYFELTDVLSGGKHVTVADVIPMFDHMISASLNRMLMQELTTLKNMLRIMLLTD